MGRLASTQKHRRTRRQLDVGVVVLGAVVFPMVALGVIVYPPLALAFSFAIATFIFASSKLPDSFAVGLAAVLLVLSSASFDVLSSFSLALRMGALGIIWIWVFSRRLLGPRARQPNTLHLIELWPFVFGFALLVGAATIPHGDYGSFALELSSTAVLILFAYALVHEFSARDARVGLINALATMITLSLLLAAAVPSIALEKGRLRGVTENANFLGFLALLLILVCLSHASKPVLFVVPVVLALAALIWSASRTSALALTVAVAIYSIQGNRRARMLLLCFTVISLFLLLAPPSVIGSVELLRMNNSRSGGFEDALRILSGTDRLFGMGIDYERVPTAGSLPRAAVTGGLLALAGLCLMYFTMFRLGKQRPERLPIVAALATSSLGESWMLSAVGPMMLLSVFVVLSSPVESSSEMTPPSVYNAVAAPPNRYAAARTSSTSETNLQHPPRRRS